METTLTFYGADLFPLSAEKASFLTSFTREATDDNRTDIEAVQFYIDTVQRIPNYETLNVKMLWTAFQILSRVDERKRKYLLNDSRFISDTFYGDKYANEVMKKLLPLKAREENKEMDLENLLIKLRAQTYSYIRLILTYL